MDRLDDAESCIRAPRDRSNVAKGARSEGASASERPECDLAKFSIQLTERISCAT